uniref:Mitochondrial glutathione transporter SLC25A39 n=1 Tax=Aquila chrysaetos chrysaetos TaxID=223781 RepID=A0A663F4Z0_AQUCH
MGLAVVRPLLEGDPSPGLGLGLEETMVLGIKWAGHGAEGKGLLSNGDVVAFHPREVFPLLQRAHGPSVRLSERQRLHRLVQGPHPLHGHTGRGCGHRQGGQGPPCPREGVGVFAGGLLAHLPPLTPLPGTPLSPGCFCEDHTLRGHQVSVERLAPHPVSLDPAWGGVWVLMPAQAHGHLPQASCQPPGRACVPLTPLLLGRVMAVPATVIYFTTYDQLRDYLHARTGSRGHHIPLLAGALARLGAVTVISPLELIRTKMQSRQLSYRELGVCIQSAVAQDGWLSLWRGWGPTVLRDVPFSALYWFNYELVKEWLCGQARLDEATFMISFASGAISGTVAAVLTLPFDVVKTQRQIELGDSEVHPVAASKPSSTWLLMRRIRAESGTRGLFAGFLPRVIKVAPACAIMISTYEFGKTFFQKLNQERRLRGL